MASHEHGHITPAHDQVHSSRLIVHYEEHGTREDDPFYHLFNEYRRRAKHDPELYQCWLGKTRGDFSDCTLLEADGKVIPLELHHRFAEWAIQQEIDLDMINKQFSDVKTRDDIGKWVESEENLIFLCRFHHRGHGGAHVASASDWIGQLFVKHLIT